MLLQAIHSRSMLPCQDSPGIKMPYTATVSIITLDVTYYCALTNNFYFSTLLS